MDGGDRRRVAAKAMDGLSAAGAWMRRSGRSAPLPDNMRSLGVPLDEFPWGKGRDARARAGLPHHPAAA